MESEHSTLLIETISVSPSNLFFCLGYNTGEVHIYSLINEEYLSKHHKKMKPAHCECISELENYISKPPSLTFFGKLVKLKDMLFEKPKKMPFSTLNFSNDSKPYISYFVKKNELVLASEIILQKFKFSSMEGGRAWCYQQIKYKDNVNSSYNKVDDDFEASENEEIV